MNNLGWTLGPFERIDSANPCLAPRASTTFFCPLRKTTVRWEEKDVFNPAAVVRNGRKTQSPPAKNQKKMVLNWQSIFDSYNEGLVGPGHCD